MADYLSRESFLVLGFEGGDFCEQIEDVTAK